MSQLDNLRDMARKRMRAAGKKISYNRRINSIEIGGTPFDPRVPASRINRYNTQQLKALISRLDRFTARTTQYVATGEGLAPKAEMREYKKFERKYNMNVQKLTARAKGKHTPFGEQSIEDSQRIRHDPEFLDNNPDFYREAHRRSKDFYNPAGLKTLTGDMKRRSKKLYLDQAASEIKKNIQKFDLGKKFKVNLTNEQLILAWQYGGLAETMKELYAHKDDLIIDSDDIIAQENDEDDNNISMAKRRINTVLDWAFRL